MKVKHSRFPNCKFLEFLACADSEQLPQQDNASRFGAQCSSTLPYALSKWPEISETRFTHDAEVRRSKLKAKSKSDSSASRSSPVEVRRKLSLLEEKRAIFQRRFFDSSKESDETVIAVTIDNLSDNPSTSYFLDQRDEERKRKARQISVRTFDTFSSLEGTLLEEAPSDYYNIEQDYTDSCDRTDDNYTRFHDVMATMVGI